MSSMAEDFFVSQIHTFEGSFKHTGPLEVFYLHKTFESSFVYRRPLKALLKTKVL